MNNTMDKTEEQLIRQEILSERSPNFQRDLKCERKLCVIAVAFCWEEMSHRLVKQPRFKRGDYTRLGEITHCDHHCNRQPYIDPPYSPITLYVRLLSSST